MFTPDFVEKNIDNDNHIGEHIKTRITIFQNQIFNMGLIFLALSILTIVFKTNLTNILKNRLTNIILLIIVIAIMLLFGEIILRLFFSNQIYNEFGSGPGGLKFQKELELNSEGFRDIEYNITKTKPRIIIIGDSFAEGHGIKNINNTFPKLLQKELQDYEIITFAKGGYSTLDELNILNNTAIKYKPDIIILAYYINDIEEKDSRKGYEQIFYHHYTYPWEIGSYLYSHSFMYYFLESRLKSLNPKDYTSYYIHLYSKSNPSFNKNHLKNFIEICSQNNIKLIILNIPAIAENYPFPFVEEYINNQSSGDIKIIHLRNQFLNYNPKDLRVSFLDNHMNEKAHNITAEVILKNVK